GAVHIEVVEGMPQLPDVLLQCPVHSPVVGSHLGDVGAVDAVRIRVLDDRVVEQQRGEVDEVLAVDLEDLQLAEQEVGWARARSLAVQPSTKIDHVRHLEDVAEDVQLAAVIDVVEVQESSTWRTNGAALLTVTARRVE